MCQLYQKLPDDPFITEMDPVQKIWLYHNWLGDHRDDAELAKNHAYLLGSFWNPDAVKEIMNQNVHESSDEDFEESLKMVTDTDVRALAAAAGERQKQAPRKRKRKATLKE